MMMFIITKGVSMLLKILLGFAVSLLSFSVYIQADETKISMYTESYPPYNMEINGKIQGISVDILDSMLQHMNSSQSKEDIVLTNWSRAYSIAQKKKNSMVFSTTLTDSRKPLFQWVGPIIKTQIGIIAPKSKNIKINSLNDLNNYKIGAVLKDIGELMLLEGGVDTKQIEHVSGNNAIELSFHKMEKNRIDMFAYEVNVALSSAKNLGFDPNKYEVVYTLNEGWLYYAFHKNTSKQIVQKWQDALDTVKSTGQYDTIVSKYK